MLNITKQISRFNHYNGRNNIQYIVIHSTGNTNDTAKNNADYFGRADRGASAHYFVDDNSIYQVVEDCNGAWHCGDGHGKYGIKNTNSISIEMCGTDNGNISRKTIENTLDLAKYLMNKYGIDASHVVRHYDASRKNCPSQFSPNGWLRWKEFKAELEGKKVENVEVKPSKPSKPHTKKLWEVSIHGQEVKNLQSELNRQCGADLKVDGYFGDSTLNACITVHPGARGNITRCIQKRLIDLGYDIRGGADGIFGKINYSTSWVSTEGAVRSVQKKNGLSVDGVVGKCTWKVLYRK